MIPLLIVPSLLNIDPGFLRISSISFRYFVFLSPWKMACLFIWKQLSPLHPRMSSAMFSWNWFSGSWEKWFLNFFNVFSLFRYLLPFGKWCDPSIKYTWIPFNQEWLLPSLIEIGPWFYRRFLSFVNEFCYFFIIQNWKRAWPIIWTN